MGPNLLSIEIFISYDSPHEGVRLRLALEEESCSATSRAAARLFCMISVARLREDGRSDFLQHDRVYARTFMKAKIRTVL